MESRKRLLSVGEWKKSRTIKLFCPSALKLVRFVAYEDDGLDLGTIARTFGLDPATLRLNGHFLSRGANLISAVTWESLLLFFHTRGFSTGADGEDAVVVDGKRSCGSSDDQSGSAGHGNASDNKNGNDSDGQHSVLGSKRKPWLEDVNLLKKRKTDQCNSGAPQFTCSFFGMNPKRMRQEEVVLVSAPCKRPR